jgi:hypothetical protein
MSAPWFLPGWASPGVHRGAVILLFGPIVACHKGVFFTRPISTMRIHEIEDGGRGRLVC